ncbi:hypothetical protein KQS06HV_91476 [Klebsiella quasipneumoniae subsp. similipneumoniae]|nr:hypothetical protein KQS06HV_91476 [Klebsiella quasipneumoniae subsp. similipneumoniae]
MNITGPGDEILTANAMKTSNGEISNIIMKENIISSSLFKTILIPFIGVSNNGTTGTPFTSSVLDWRILKVNISGIKITEHVVSVRALISCFIFNSSLILIAKYMRSNSPFLASLINWSRSPLYCILLSLSNFSLSYTPTTEKPSHGSSMKLFAKLIPAGIDPAIAILRVLYPKYLIILAPVLISERQIVIPTQTKKYHSISILNGRANTSE